MKLSIIVPVYGVEKYIEQCLSSLLLSDLYDYEIIVVNDGTKDRSMDIVREKFCDSRIRILDQTNKGLSAARNYGINEARGEYVWMFDSDDWAETNLISDVINNLNNIDLLYFTSYYRNHDDTGIETIDKLTKNVMSGVDLFCSRYFHPAPFYIIKKDLLLSNNLLFTEGILHEDSLFTPIMLTFCKTVLPYPQIVYHYRQRSGSITKTVSTKRLKDLQFVITRLIEFSKSSLGREIKYKWGRCVSELTNELLFISQNSNDKEGLKNVKKFVNQTKDIKCFLIHSGYKNALMGVLSYLMLGNLWDIYKIIYFFRYKLFAR